MKNWEKILQELDEDTIILELVEKRLLKLNPCMFDPDCWSFGDFICDDGNGYYWPSEARQAEARWLKQEAKDE